MGIKLKNKYIKAFTFIIAMYMFALSLMTVVNIRANSDYLFKNSKSYILNSSQFNTYIDNATIYFIDYKGFSEKTESEKVTNDDINKVKETYDEKYKESEQQINQEYENKIKEANSSLSESDIKVLLNEKFKKLTELKNNYDNDIKSIKKGILAVKAKDYAKYKKYIQDRKNIKYYVVDKNKGTIYTNIEKTIGLRKYIDKNALYYIKYPGGNGNSYNYYDDIYKTNGVEAYFIIPNKVKGYDQIYEDAKYFSSINRRLKYEIYITLGSFCIGIILLFLLRRNKESLSSKINYLILKLYKIPLCLKIAVFILYSFFMITYMRNVNFFYKPLGISHFLKLSFVLIYVLYLIFSAVRIIKIIKNPEERMKLGENLFICRFTAALKESLQIKKILVKAMAILISTILFTMFLILALNAYENRSLFIFSISTIYIFGYLLIVPIYVLKKIGQLNNIIIGTEDIANGNLSSSIKEEGNDNLYNLSHNINNMRDGFKTAVDSQVKSERMKTELITNVSHDLKTPLTSIINYIDLLKKKDLSKEEMDGYIGVLDRKSQRLKVLIEDLFEAAKMTSGAVEFNYEKIDVVALLNQAIGEFDEKIKKASLTFRINSSKRNIYLNLDGKKTFRVFDNLINNIIKYSQPDTRVFVDAAEDNDKVVITMKNISAYEMNFDAEEIFERFKRGDKSRNTEGSGLGLAIAKSIVELQGGKLKIDIDGDLFKVIIEFKKYITQ